MRGRRLLVGVGVLLLLVFGIVAVTASPVAASGHCDVTVPGDNATIQGAVDAANPDETVCVDDDTYTEEVVVDKPLTLQANGSNVVLDGENTNQTAFTVVSNGVTIDGFTIQNYGNGTDPGFGVFAGDLNGLTVQGNHVQNVSGFGVAMLNVSDADVNTNTFASDGVDDATPIGVATGASGTAHNVTVADNTITGTYNTSGTPQEALIAAWSLDDTGTISELTIHGNTLDADVQNGQGRGIHVEARIDTIVQALTVTDNQINGTVNVGIGVEAIDTGAAGLDISGNTVTGTDSHGIAVQSTGSNAAVEGVSIAGNTVQTTGADAVLVHAHDGLMGDVSIDSSPITDVNGSGVLAMSTGAGSMDTVTLANNDVSQVADGGVSVIADNTATSSNVNVVDNDVSDADTGVFVAAGGDAFVGNIVVDGNQVLEHTTAGILVGGFGGTVDSLSASDNEVNSTWTSQGLVLAADSGGNVARVHAEGNDLRGNENGVLMRSGANANILGTSIVGNHLNDTVHNGVFLETFDDDTATIDSLLVEENVMHNSTYGLHGQAPVGNISNVHVTGNLVEETDYGVELNATQTGTISHLNVSANAFLNQSTEGVLLNATDGGQIHTVELSTQVLEGEMTRAVSLESHDGGDLHTVEIHEILVEDTGQALNFRANNARLANVTVREVLLDGNGYGTVVWSGDQLESVSIQESIIRNSQSEGLVAIGHGSDITASELNFTRNLLRNNTGGVNNLETGTVLEATGNYWGASDGPSTGGSTIAKDPDSNVFADGSGDPVSDPDGDAVSNVNFAPAIGGKHVCEGTPVRTEGGQLVDMVPEGDISIDVGDETISGPQTDFVGLCLWDRAALPLRADTTPAVTRVPGPDVVINQNGVDVPVNRQELAVYETGTAIPFEFQSVSGATDTQMFADEDAQLVVGRLTGAGTGDVSIDVDVAGGQASFQSSELEFVEVVDTELDANGELAQPVAFTPSDDGVYVAVLVSQTTGDGVDTDGSTVQFDVHEDDLTIVGVESVAVQTTASSVQPDADPIEPGDTATFDVDANLGETENVTHGLVMYHDQSARDLTARITDFNATFDEDNLTIQSGNATVEVSDGSTTETIEVEVTDLVFESGVISGTFNNESVSEENDVLSGQFVIVSDVSLIDGDATNTTAGDQVQLSIPTQTDWTEGDYRVVHVAATDDGRFSTSERLLTVQEATETTPPSTPPSTPPPSTPPSTTPPPAPPVADVVVNKTAPDRIVVDVPGAVSRNFTFTLPRTDAMNASGIRITQIRATSSVEQDIGMQLNTSQGPPGDVPAVAGDRTGHLYLDVDYDVDPSVWERSTFWWRASKGTFRDVDAEAFQLYRYNETSEAWEPIETTVLDDGGLAVRLRSDADGFSTYAFSTQDASFEVTDASLGESEIEAGDSVDVEATVENNGQGSGTFTAELTVDGEVVDTQDVTVDPGASETVTFTQAFDEPGEYDVAVSGESAGTLSVLEPDTPTPTPVPAGPPAPGDDDVPWTLYALGLLFVIALGLVGRYIYTHQEELGIQ